MTTETKFTPAPWEVDIFGDVQANGDDVARIAGYYGEEVNDANAHLIAAAPDMYAALKDARAIAMRMAAKADIPYCAEFGEIAQILDAALAKAEGKA